MYNGHKQRLRDKFKQDGLNGFLPYEVLEFLLSFVQIRKDTKKSAKLLIQKFGSLCSVLNAPLALLKDVEGIGDRSAQLIKLCNELLNYTLREKILQNEYLNSVNDVITYVKHYYKAKKYEEFKIIYLNSQNQILFEETLFNGTVNKSSVYVRNLIERVLHFNAVAIVLFHNHPGGSLKPSDSDIKITKKIYQALNLLDIKLYDHLIIAGNNYYSFASSGLLDKIKCQTSF